MSERENPDTGERPSGPSTGGTPVQQPTGLGHRMLEFFRTRTRTTTIVLVLLWFGLLAFYSFSSEHYPPRVDRNEQQVTRQAPPPSQTVEPTSEVPTTTESSETPTTSETPDTGTRQQGPEGTGPNETGGPTSPRTSERPNPWPSIQLPVPTPRTSETTTPESRNNG